MQRPPAWETLKQFRLAAYRTLGHRKDSLFELMEAVLAGSGPATLVRLSLAAVFRRAWPSAPDALADGAVDADACRRLVQSTPIEPATGGVRSGRWMARSGRVRRPGPARSGRMGIARARASRR